MMSDVWIAFIELDRGVDILGVASNSETAKMIVEAHLSDIMLNYVGTWREESDRERFILRSSHTFYQVEKEPLIT